jgi:tape measure domain-containing protein
MNNNGGNYVYALGLDTAAFASSVDKAKRMFQGLGDTATAAGEEADEAFNKMKNSIASVAAGVSLGMLAKKVAEVRGEVQQLEVAFETMLGSKQKADALMAQMVELAAKTPFGLQDVTNGAKQLLAFGSASEEVASEITMLGDIASGLSIPLGDLIYLYGTTRTQGKLFTVDLKQFMGRGIPLAEELAKAMNKTTDEVMELVSAGKVGFPEVQKALQGMTSEGGQFGGLMEKQAQTITGQISALQDAIYQMFNEIGESSEGVINTILSGAGTIVANYEKIIKVLTVIIATYGAYKAAVILTAAAQKAMFIAQEAQAFFQLAKGVKSAQEAMLLLNAATRKNPWGLVLAAIAAVVAAIWAYCESTEEATEAQNEFDAALAGSNVGEQITQVKMLSAAYKKLGDDMDSRRKFIEENKSAFDSLGVSITDTATADKLFIDQTDDFIDALQKRAKAEAAKKLSDEAYLKAIEAEMKVDELRRAGKRDRTTSYTVENSEFAQMFLNKPKYEVVTEDTELGKAIKEAKEANNKAAQYFRLASELQEVADSAFEGVETSDNTDKTEPDENAIKKLAAARVKLAGDTRRAMTEAEINAMEEGIAKKLKQIDYEYDEEERKIAEREAELRALAGGSLSESDAANIVAMRAANAKNKETKTTQAWDEVMAEAGVDPAAMEQATAMLQAELVKRNKAWEDYLIQFGTFQERFKATQDKYSRLIAEAQTEGERKTLEAERDAALAAFEVQASAWAKDLANKSIAELNKMMQELEEQVKAKQEAFDALESSDSAEAKDYLKTINELKAKIAELKKQLSGASKEAKGGNREGAAQVVQGIASAAEDAAGALEGVDDELANTINGMAKCANVAASLVSAIAAVAAASTALNMVLGVIGLIATAIQVVSTAIGSIVQANNEFRETLNKIKELNKELAQMQMLSRIDSVEGTIFGSDAFGNFANNLSVLRDATTELNKSREAIRLWARDKFAELGFDEDTLNLLEFENYVDALKEMRVKLKDAGKFAEAFGAKDEYADLGDIFPELFGDEGVTLEGLQKLKDSDIWEKLSKKHRDLIDQMIKDWEVFNESTEAVTAYLTDIFGEMGNSINDAIVEAFMNGSDAALEFGDIAGQVIENLIKQVGYSAYIAPILTQAMADVEALNEQGLSAEEYLNALMGIVGDAMKVAGENVEAYNEFLENADQYAESVGINTFDSERSAQSKGIAQASQDSVDELNGRMTAIQGHTYSLMEGQRQLINDSAQVLRHLAGIESNTAELRQMRLDMAAMRSDISDIATRGIITR